MRIASLLPSATELICGLGLQRQLVGVSHECDYPPGVETLPALTRPRIPPGLPSVEIDRLVTEQLNDDEALYTLELTTMQKLAPDLIVTQALCDVCAVSGSDVAKALAALPGNPKVVNLEPSSLADVLYTIMLVANAAGCAEKGEAFIKQLSIRVAEVEKRTRGIAANRRPRVAMLDWLDPLFDGGHWCPELIELAGGIPTLGESKKPSRRRSWQELVAAAPDVIFIALCGLDIERSMEDVNRFLRQATLSDVNPQAIYLVDGNAYFSRPGPRLVDSLEIMANAIHPDVHPLPAGLDKALEVKPEGIQ